MSKYTCTIHRVLTISISLLLLIACSRDTRTVPISHSATSTPDPEYHIYTAAIDAFFAHSGVKDRMTPRWNLQSTLYIQPTFVDTQKPIPLPVLEHIRTHIQQFPVQEISTSDPRGVIVTLSSISHDPQAEMIAQAKVPTIHFAIQTGRGGAITKDNRGYIGIGFYVIQTTDSYTAHQYLEAVP